MARRQSFEDFQAENPRERDPKLSVELFKAVEYLAFAKNLLKTGRTKLAKKYADEAKRTAMEAKRLHKEVLKRVSGMEKKVYHAKMIGYETSKSEALLEEAKSQVLETKYKQSIQTLEKCKSALYRSQFLPFPLLDTRVKMKTLITFEEGNIIFRVKLENHMDEDMGEIILIPSVPQDVFTELPEQLIGDLKSNQSKEITFTLTPKIENWNIGIPGALIQGRDVTVRTILSCDYGEARYKVRIENNTDAFIENLVVSPFVPGGLEPDENEKVIPVISPLEGETVVFVLRPIGYAELHEGDEEIEEPVQLEMEDESEWDQASWEFTEDDDDEEEEEEEDEDDDVDWEMDDEDDEEEEEEEDDFEDLEATGFRQVKEGFSFISSSPDKVHNIKRKGKT